VAGETLILIPLIFRPLEYQTCPQRARTLGDYFRSSIGMKKAA